ncbi:YbaB/EbfC family nucleoid-associated protein [Thermoleophilum album]|uniref:YbaB/EbfC family nucleoid-associated protein n=1 Tax=Thermoleophilum album TaxID=29539 RepID=UPI000CC25CF2|nr:YbaB/EbfC family nucleoid-associated protein [Thermoleophilum album]MCL6441738.1 YbaB/EbfC family nucleoid-associated protein [Thermoleophilum sp.]WDT93901.1 YbaB/EbfC family nucleoid-associated protein [Thermoleophilum album]GBD45527.1 Nucleoid-associated protein [bacterium HR41]
MKKGKQPNLGDLVKQAQRLQAEVAKAQEELKAATVEASAGGGMVRAVVSGDLELRELHIDPRAIDPDDAEIVAEMVMAAVNEALRSAQELANRKLGAATGGLAGMLPGELGLPPF